MFSGQAEVFAFAKPTQFHFVQLRNEDDADEGRYLVVRAAGEGVAHAAGQIGNSIWKRKESDGGGSERLPVDLLRPTRYEPSEDVLNLLSTFILRP